MIIIWFSFVRNKCVLATWRILTSTVTVVRSIVRTVLRSVIRSVYSTKRSSHVAASQASIVASERAVQHLQTPANRVLFQPRLPSALCGRAYSQPELDTSLSWNGIDMISRHPGSERRLVITAEVKAIMFHCCFIADPLLETPTIAPLVSLPLLRLQLSR